MIGNIVEVSADANPNLCSAVRNAAEAGREQAL